MLISPSSRDVVVTPDVSPIALDPARHLPATPSLIRALQSSQCVCLWLQSFLEELVLSMFYRLYNVFDNVSRATFATDALVLKPNAKCDIMQHFWSDAQCSGTNEILLVKIPGYTGISRLL